MKLSVLQWNVWFQESADNVLQLIRETDADVACLQELTQDSVPNPNRDIPADIEKLGYSKAYLPIHKRTGDQHIKMGNGIFSKVPIIGTRYTYVQHADPNSESYSKENRVYIEVTIQANANDAPLKIGTVHLSYTHKFEYDESKTQEADKLLAAIRGNKNRFILTGDLNSTPNSYAVQGLSRLLYPADPAYSEQTWATKPFSYKGFEASSLDWRLDYVFRTADIRVLSTEVIKTDYSDHLPILTTFEI